MSDDIDWDYQASRALLLNLGLSETLAIGGIVARSPYDLDDVAVPYTSTRLALLLGLPIDFQTREHLRESLRKALGIDYA